MTDLAIFMCTTPPALGFCWQTDIFLTQTFASILTDVFQKVHVGKYLRSGCQHCCYMFAGGSVFVGLLFLVHVHLALQ